MNHTYTMFIKCTVNNKYIQTFIDEQGGYAFLEIKPNGHYGYLDYETYLLALSIFADKPVGVRAILDDQKYHFIPKVLIKGVPVALTAALLAGCGDTYEPPKTEKFVTLTTESTNTTNTEVVVDEKIEADKKFIRYLSTADDDVDFHYENDFDIIGDGYYVRDQSAYKTIYGYDFVSLDKINEAIDQNNKISNEYKLFFKDYAKNWLELYPGSDLSTFYTNIKTLTVKKESQASLDAKTRTSGSAEACYDAETNTIFFRDSIDFSDKNSDGFIVATHETTHVARSTKTNLNGHDITVQFTNRTDMGFFIEEALINDFAYQLQGNDNKSHYYILQSNYARVILDCISYTGTDYMNHGVNYLIEKMDEAMINDPDYHDKAFRIIAMIDAEANLHYRDYYTVDYHEFDDIFTYLSRLYFNKYINDTMSYEDCVTIKNNLYNELTYLNNQMANPYKLSTNIIDSEFNNLMTSYGITPNIQR